MSCLLRLLLFLFFMSLPSAPVGAVEPDEILKDPVLEQRARDISLHLRCLVCQNQSIDDSNAPLAKDLRVLVRERLSNGDSNAQVIDFVVARYGEFVLLKPRFARHTLILWLAPPLLFLVGVFLMLRAYRNRRQLELSARAMPLTLKEKRALKKLLDES